jgi:hypothetical protein
MEKTDIVNPTFKPAQRSTETSRNPSMAQAANLKNLRKGDIPTLASVPAMIANKAEQSVHSFVREGMKQRPNRLRDGALVLKDIVTGKKPLIATGRKAQTER